MTSYLHRHPLAEMKFLLLLPDPLQNIRQPTYLPNPSIAFRDTTGIFIPTTHSILQN
jgi:hypothetical protein